MITESLKGVNLSVKEDIHTQLAIGQKAGESYDSDLHNFLQGTLKMTECKVTKELDAKQKSIQIASSQMVLLKEFTTIKEIFGDKAIIDFKGLISLCREHDLYFGHTSLFTGDMAKSAIEEAKAFDYIKARSILKTAGRRHGESVISWDYYACVYDLIIMAPIGMFKLDHPNKVIISNREIILHDKGSTSKNRSYCPTHDPVLLMPFLASNKKVYFIVITNW